MLVLVDPAAPPTTETIMTSRAAPTIVPGAIGPSARAPLVFVAASVGVIAALLGTGVAASAAQTIVGTWAPDPAACTPVGGMISIGAMSLTGDERQCQFHDVGRTGHAITWRGTCADGSTRTPTTVVAALHRRTLIVMINGEPSGTYRRCNPR